MTTKSTTASSRFLDYVDQFSEPAGYLNFARYGPPSGAVVDAASQVLARSSQPKAGTLEAIRSGDANPVRAVADFLGVDPASVCMIPNTSTGLFQTAMGLSGGSVAVSPMEFPANVYPWRRAEQMRRIRIVEINAPDGRVTSDAVKAALSDDVVALSVSAVDFRTGYRADLAALREVIGDRLLVIDGIQAFGAIDMAWELADVLVAGGQKWLRAGWSTGFMVVSPRALDRLEPNLSGWTGVEDHASFDGATHAPKPGAARFALSHVSPVAAAALDAAIRLVSDVGITQIEDAIALNVESAIAVIDRHGGTLTSPASRNDRAGIITFSLSGCDPDTFADAFAATGVSATTRGAQIRISPHATTSADSLEMLDESLARIRRA